MRVNDTIKIEKTYLENEVAEDDVDSYLIATVTEFEPARMAPPCSNPSSPAYSDPGDDAYMDYILYIKNDATNKVIQIEDDSDLYEDTWDEIYNKMSELAGDR